MCVHVAPRAVGGSRLLNQKRVLGRTRFCISAKVGGVKRQDAAGSRCRQFEEEIPHGGGLVRTTSAQVKTWVDEGGEEPQQSLPQIFDGTNCILGEVKKHAKFDQVGREE